MAPEVPTVGDGFSLRESREPGATIKADPQRTSMKTPSLIPTLLAAVLLACSGLLHAAPVGLADADVRPISKLSAVLLPAVDTLGARKAAPDKPLRLRFALPITTAISPDTAGEWETLADGRLLWRALIRSSDASSLNFAFGRYHLPAGAALYLYSPDGSQLSGPHTASHNAAGQLWTPLLRGNEAVIELSLPAAAREQLDLELTQVNHGFLEFWEAGAREKSGNCNIDVVCPQGDTWRDEIRSVARYTIGGQFLCSGQLVNNTSGDFTPYFLTAHHCLSSEAEALSTVFYWNYQTSSCGGVADGRMNQNQSGASLVATYSVSDFTLLRLSQKPDSSFKVYYAGWESSTDSPSGVTCIHHPAGDEKRISFSSGSAKATSYGGSGGGDGTHLQVVRWDAGTTEGGSSGSGLWNSQKRLVGQLHGGNAACDTPDGSDWFGRLAVSWTGGGTAESSLKAHLAPVDSTVSFLDGADPAAKSASLDKSVTLPGRFGGGMPLLLLGVLAGAAALRQRLRVAGG